MHAIESWSAPPDLLEPPEETIHLWRIELDGAAEDLLLMLSPDEQDRAQRLNSQQARDRFILARSAMRSILGRYLGTPAEGLRFDYSEKGKPYLREPPINIHFNLSHAQNRALFAVAPTPVGIDLEQLRERGDLARIAARMFPHEILQEMDGLQGDALTGAFFQHWTYLESCTKCRGSGLFGPRENEERFFTAHFTPEQGWISCLACTRPLAHISTWKTLQY
jgi:4'-phosphopantetheinyl transferase